MFQTSYHRGTRRNPFGRVLESLMPHNLVLQDYASLTDFVECSLQAVRTAKEGKDPTLKPRINRTKADQEEYMNLHKAETELETAKRELNRQKSAARQLIPKNLIARSGTFIKGHLRNFKYKLKTIYTSLINRSPIKFLPTGIKKKKTVHRNQSMRRLLPSKALKYGVPVFLGLVLEYSVKIANTQAFLLHQNNERFAQMSSQVILGRQSSSPKPDFMPFLDNVGKLCLNVAKDSMDGPKYRVYNTVDFAMKQTDPGKDIRRMCQIEWMDPVLNLPKGSVFYA